MAFLAGWFKRRQFVVTTSTSANNYPLLIRVGESSGSSGYDTHCEGLVLPTFNDIRFTSSDDVMLDYWIETLTGSSPNQTANIWVELNTITTAATGTTFYLYYNNSGASSASSGENTFAFFDDFTTETVGTKWQIETAADVFSDSEQSNTYIDSSASVATLCGQMIGYMNFVTKTFSASRPIIFESKTRMMGGINGTVRCSLMYRDKAVAYSAGWHYYACYTGTALAIYQANSLQTSQAYSAATSTYYIWRLELTPTNVTARLFDRARTELVTANHTNNTYDGGGIGLDCYIMVANYKDEVDWVLARSYLSPIPSAGAWGTSENSPLSDTVVIDDSFSRIWQIHLSLEDAVGIHEEPGGREWEAHITLADDIGIDDALQASRLLFLTDEIGIHDADPTYVWIYGRTFTDDVGIDDNLSRQWDIVRTYEDDVGVDDTYAAKWIVRRTFEDDVVVDEETAKSIKSVLEDIVTTDEELYKYVKTFIADEVGLIEGGFGDLVHHAPVPEYQFTKTGEWEGHIPKSVVDYFNIFNVSPWTETQCATGPWTPEPSAGLDWPKTLWQERYDYFRSKHMEDKWFKPKKPGEVWAKEPSGSTTWVQRR